MSSSFDNESVVSFVAGTVGRPGERAFFLQAVAEDGLVSLAVEKQQVAVLAQRLLQILDDLPAPTESVAPPTFIEPVTTDWTVGQMMVAVQEDGPRIVLLFEEFPEFDPEEFPDLEPDLAQARFVLTLPQARTFAREALGLVASGRPVCRLCLAPMDPDGHACPRWN